MNEIDKFNRGIKYLDILAPLKKKNLYKNISLKDEYLNLKCVKFIPASGAATRMFQELYEYSNTLKKSKYMLRFFAHLKDFPFFSDLDLDDDSDSLKVVKSVIDNYGELPKALIKVHKYENVSLTPIEEHVKEGIGYLNKDLVRLHFTISSEHEEIFKDYIKGLKCEGIDFSYSFQKKHTDTIAVDMSNKPFLKDDGEVLYRPGGHGALIENLNDIDADIVFIKNIDNVCNDKYLDETIKNKKILASIGFDVKKEINKFILDINNGVFEQERINRFLKKVLNINIKGVLNESLALKLLKRPLRVVGVVKNQGAVGGGPFVVDNGDYSDVQILEKSEVDFTRFKDIFNSSDYFNPVDIVCFLKDESGIKYNLLGFVNNDRYFISRKTYKGRDLKALEHPGLWNGAMHNFNSVYVEVPLITFNPIKSVNDLLEKGHIG